MIKAALIAGGNQDALSPGQIYIMSDGKAHSNSDRMQKAFQDQNGKAIPKQKKTVYVMTTEESERETKERMAGVATLPTMEITNIYTAVTLSVPFRKRLHCGGSNASDTLGPLQQPKRSELWCVKQSLKGKMYGTGWVEAGGKVEGDAGPEQDPAPRANDDVPFCWHSKSAIYYTEIMHAYNITAWWDLTAADAILPMLAVRNKFPYLGVCHTRLHQEGLEEECIEQIFKAMQDPAHALFESKLNELINPAGISEAKPPVSESGGQASPGGQASSSSSTLRSAPKVGSAPKPGKAASASAASILQRLQSLDDQEID